MLCWEPQTCLDITVALEWIPAIFVAWLVGEKKNTHHFAPLVCLLSPTSTISSDEALTLNGSAICAFLLHKLMRGRRSMSQESLDCSRHPLLGMMGPDSTFCLGVDSGDSATKHFSVVYFEPG